MGFVAAVLVSAVVTCCAHVWLGWEWTLLGGFIGGLLSPYRAPLAGALIGGVSWGGLVAYNLIVALESVGAMLETMGAIFGGVPGPILGAASIALGALLGLLGALPGGILRGAWLSHRKTAVVQTH